MKKQNSIYWKCATGYAAIQLLKALDSSNIIIQHRGETGRLLDSKNCVLRGPYPGHKKDQIEWVKQRITLRFDEYIVIKTP